MSGWTDAGSDQPGAKAKESRVEVHRQPGEKNPAAGVFLGAGGSRKRAKQLLRGRTRGLNGVAGSWRPHDVRAIRRVGK